MKKRPQDFKPHFMAAVTGEVVSVDIFEEIGEDYWSYDGGITAKSVKKAIDGAGAFSRIQVNINSPGGDAFEGLAVGNVLKSYGKPVDVTVYGLAASAASIIMMAGTTRKIYGNALVMVHRAWAVCMGNVQDMTEMASALGKIDEAIAETYVSVTGKSAKDIGDMLAAETWLTAQECVDQGFATEIEPGPAPSAALAMAAGFKSLAKMKAVPETLKAAAAPPPKNIDMDSCMCECNNCVNGNCPDCTNELCDSKNCEDCPMQGAAADALATAVQANAALAECELAMAERRIRF